VTERPAIECRLGPCFGAAFEFAARKHDGQTRKGKTVPYLAHLLSVTSIVLEAGGDEECAIAALLHDVVEDCGGVPVLREVEEQFGPRVARIVEGCTDAFTDPKPPWQMRKEDYLERLRDEDSHTRLVSAADKLDNARSVLLDYRTQGESIWTRFQGGREGTLWYYRALAEEFKRCPPNQLAAELDRVVSELERVAGAVVCHGSAAEE
jgi:(p)ppGpp synthase/HD superfamily hydrolase